MTRVLSSAAVDSAFAQETDEAWLIFMVVDHANIEEPLRLVANEVDVVRSGTVAGAVSHANLDGVYTAFPFEVVMPGESDQVPTAQIRVANADRLIVDTLRQLINLGAPKVTLDVALASAPHDIQYGPMELRMIDAQYDAFFVTAELGVEDSLSRRFPADRFDNPNFPALFPG